MDSAGSRHSDQRALHVLATQESRLELWWAGVVLGWHVYLAWLELAVCHVRCLVKGVTNLQCWVWVFDFLCLGGELLGLDVLLDELGHVVLDLGVNIDIEVSGLAHLSKRFMLEGQLRILERQFSVTLCHKQVRTSDVRLMDYLRLAYREGCRRC